MTRPGPRPYECVRRAWHSDRHQPIRGSLIQEIFRIVNDVHSPSTKKNREWQEKLPIVVLKAEEILYSKANSEGEYMDLKTLWERTNDAINTVIRRDERTESGNCLYPCIEAALNLGCTPRRASRSQQNNAPICYLNSSSPDASCVPWRNFGNKTDGLPHSSNLMKSIANNIALDSCPPVKIDNGSSTSLFHFPSGNSNKKIPTIGCPNSCAVYPLYYEDGVGSSCKSKSHSNPLSCNLVTTASKITQKDILCDLSLRLGPITAAPCTSTESNWPHDMEDPCSSVSHEGAKTSDLSLQNDKDLSFCPKTNSDYPLDSCLGRWSFDSDNLSLEAAVRKRKAIANHPSEDSLETQLQWQTKLPFSHLMKRMSNAGS